MTPVTSSATGTAASPMEATAASSVGRSKVPRTSIAQPQRTARRASPTRPGGCQRAVAGACQVTTRKSPTVIVALASGLVVYFASALAFGLLFSLVAGRFGIGTAEDDMGFVLLYLIARALPPICAMLTAIRMVRRFPRLSQS